MQTFLGKPISMTYFATLSDIPCAVSPQAAAVGG